MKYSGLILGFVAILLSACGPRGTNLHTLALTDGPGTTKSEGGPNPQGGTTGGNPILTSENLRTNPSLLSVCMIGKPVLLGGLSKEDADETALAIAEPFDLVTGSAKLALVSEKSGTYMGVSITYSKGCVGEGYSVRVKNKHGEIETSETITIQFDGRIVLLKGATPLELNIQPILRGLAVVTDSRGLLNVFESTRGTVRQ